MNAVENIIAIANDDLLQLERECSRNITETRLFKDKEIIASNSTLNQTSIVFDCEGDVKKMRYFTKVGEKLFNKWCRDFNVLLNKRRSLIKSNIVKVEDKMEQNKKDVEVVRTIEEQRYYLDKYGREQESIKYWRKRMDSVDEVIRDVQAVEIRKLQKRVELLKEKSSHAEVMHSMVIDWIKKEFQDAYKRTNVTVPSMKQYEKKLEQQVELPVKHRSKSEKPYVPKVDVKQTNTTKVDVKPTSTKKVEQKQVNNTEKVKKQNQTKKVQKKQNKQQKQTNVSVAQQVKKAYNTGKGISAMTPAMANGESSAK